MPVIYWTLLPLHLIAIVVAAYATHHANCLNVSSCKGDYSAWMSYAHYAYEILDKLRWITPIVFGVFYFRKEILNARKVVIFGLVVTGIAFGTMPIYLTLINYWERSWGTI